MLPINSPFKSSRTPRIILLFFHLLSILFSILFAVGILQNGMVNKDCLLNISNFSGPSSINQYNFDAENSVCISSVSLFFTTTVITFISLFFHYKEYDIIDSNVFNVFMSCWWVVCFFTMCFVSDGLSKTCYFMRAARGDCSVVYNFSSYVKDQGSVVYLSLSWLKFSIANGWGVVVLYSWFLLRTFFLLKSYWRLQKVRHSISR